VLGNCDTGFETEMPSEDREWLAVAVAQIEQAAATAVQSIEVAARALGEAHRAHDHGAPLVEMVDGLVADGGRELRLSAAQAIMDYERALLHFRAQLIAHLVSEEGMTLSAAARHLRISRQRASRLLASLDEAEPPPAGDAHHESDLKVETPGPDRQA